MTTKIYINDPDVITTPGSTIIETTTIDRKVIRYTFSFEGNPEFDLSGLPPGLEPADGNYGRIAMDIEKNGSLFVGIDKTFTDNIWPLVELYVFIGLTPPITASNLSSNLHTYNNVSSVTYSVATSDNVFGYRDVYIDIDCLSSDDFVINNFYNNTTNIYFDTTPATQSTYQVVSTQSVVIEPTSSSFDNFKLLDLYDDETINLTSKLSDVEKLSNVFTDFSNSFTVPATPNNTALFKHYYDIDIYNDFNTNIRVKGYIEIDSFPFRYGKIQLEKINLKSHRPSSYKITFYGALLQLDDIFGDDTINQLDYDKEIIQNIETLVKVRTNLSQFDYQYNSGNFINSINLPTFKDGNVITPLIGYANRDWNYRDGQGDATNDLIDISTSVGAILDSELRPALRIKNIIEGIQAKYGIIFSSNFLEKAVFNNLFIWMNGNVIITADRFDLLLSYYEQNDTSLYYDNVNIDNNIFSFTDTGYNWEAGNFYNLTTYINNVTMKDGSSAVGTSITFELLNIDNEVIFTETKVMNDSNPYLSFNYYINQSNSTPVDYAFKFRFICTDDIKYDYTRVFLANNFGTGPYDTVIVRGYSNLLIKPENNLPNMKVKDFITGIMKMFKLVIRPISETQFYLNTLDGYYSDGNVLDITDYVDHEDVGLERFQIYKNIKFKYKKTNNVLGRKFRETYDLLNDEIGYGDLRSSYPLIQDKNDLSVELPFENMLFERMSNLYTGTLTNIVIGQAINTDDFRTFNRNNCGPILFFNNGLNKHSDDPVRVKFSDETPGTFIYSYNVGNTNDVILNQITDTINFGAEIDPWHLQTISNSLYLNYWSNWVNTIYSLRQRKFVYEATLPTRFVEELSLNDRLIINDHRYKINDYTINLTTGKTKLNLFTDTYNPYVETEQSFFGSTFSISPLVRDFTGANLRGSFFLYGTFTNYDGLVANKVVKIGSNGMIDTTFDSTLLGPNINPSRGNRIYKYDDDRLLVAGSFSSYNAVSGSNVRRLNPNGSVDTTFTPGTFSSSSYVYKVIVQPDSKILLGGKFTTYNGVTSKNIVRLNSDGSIDTSLVLASGLNGTFVSDVILSGDTSIYVTGDFTTYKGLTATNIVKMTLTGSKDSAFIMGTFSPATGRYVMLETYNESDSVYVGGDFTKYKGVTASRITKIKSNGSIDTSFVSGSGFNGPINSIRYTEDMRLFISGSFSSYDGVTQSNVIILNNNGTISQTFTQTGLTNYFNIGNDVYATDTTNKLVKLTSDLGLNVFNTNIIMNAGMKYYELYVSSNTDWVVEKVNLGFGTDWIDILTPIGNGSSSVQILINEKASQTGPEVYLSRKMAIKVRSGYIEKWVNILQTGL